MRRVEVFLLRAILKPTVLSEYILYKGLQRAPRQSIWSVCIACIKEVLSLLEACFVLHSRVAAAFVMEWP